MANWNEEVSDLMQTDISVKSLASN